MPTPVNAPYKKAQRVAERAYDNRGKVIWVSCEVHGLPGTFFPQEKHTVQGTRRVRHNQQQLRGKAAIKAAKKLSHGKRHYHLQRLITGFGAY